MRAPIRPIRERWPSWLQRRLARFFWADPTVILDAAADPEEFRGAMSAIHVGQTIKITGANRHAQCDSLLIDNVDLSSATIVDIGASDGTTSVELIGRLPGFKSYIIADLYLDMAATTVLRHTLFYDPDGACVLVAGRRLLAWPTQSRAVRLLYSPLLRIAARRDGRRRKVLLLNPEVRALIASDPRVTYQVHDVFDPWVDPRPDVIKVANLLRRLYFSDADIRRALISLLASLPEGGHLLIVDNPRIKGMGPRGGLYRRNGQRFETVARTPDIPEIDDLIVTVGEKV